MLGSDSRRTFTLGAALALTAIAVPAYATLGRPFESVEQDRVRIAARMAGITSQANYRVHSLTQANGALVREYAANDGTVFAVAWRGPGHADLRQLLGDSFMTMQASRADVAPIARRAAIAVSSRDLVLRSMGHPGGFFGFAYLPDRLPEGFPLDALR